MKPVRQVHSPEMWSQSPPFLHWQTWEQSLPKNPSGQPAEWKHRISRIKQIIPISQVTYNGSDYHTSQGTGVKLGLNLATSVITFVCAAYWLTLSAIQSGPSWGALAFAIVGAAVGPIVTITRMDAVGSPLTRWTSCKKTRCHVEFKWEDSRRSYIVMKCFIRYTLHHKSSTKVIT